MKQLLLLATFSIGILFTSPVYSADLHKGMEAFNVGDFATALSEWEPLANQGEPFAQYLMGVMYHEGNGVPQNTKVAIKWYTKAAEQGLHEAQRSLGVLYYSGEGVPQDYKTAFHWLTLAANQGNDAAQVALGMAYYTGKGAV
ncbi:MAG: sel1 repeat family protein, partial [Rhodospirillales bacterium]|nr:sel1 repeat family protein [Rhodospirillales bacterium]